MPNTLIATHCSCGDTQLEISGAPLIRFICHCEICQAVYKKPFADIIAIKTSQLVKPISSRIQFQKHRRPPAVNRGICPSCKQPVLANLSLIPFFGISFIPSANFAANANLPAPCMHNFYNRRVADANDNLPKASGYWHSQWALSTKLTTSLLR